jgi:hypothetical protein
MKEHKEEGIFGKALENIANTLKQKAEQEQAKKQKDAEIEEKLWEGIFGSLQNKVENNQSLEEHKTQIKDKITDLIGNMIFEKIVGTKSKEIVTAISEDNIESAIDKALEEESIEDIKVVLEDSPEEEVEEAEELSKEEDIVEQKIEINAPTGLSLRWRGEYKITPGNPRDFDIYRDTRYGAVYLRYDNKWNLLVKDGESVRSPVGGGLGEKDVLRLIAENAFTGPISAADVFVSTSAIVNLTADNAQNMFEEIDALLSSGAGGGEINTGNNVGSGAEIFKDKTGTVLNFRSVSGTGTVSAFVSGDEVIINGTETWPSVSGDYYNITETNDLVMEASAAAADMRGRYYNQFTSVSANYTLTLDDQLIHIEGTSAVTITIPSSADIDRKEYSILNESDQIATITAESGFVVPYNLRLNYNERYDLVYDEKGWHINGFYFGDGSRNGLLSLEGTGAARFDGISINAVDSNTFDVSAIVGRINNANSIFTPPVFVNFPGLTGIVPEGLASSAAKTYIGLKVPDTETNAFFTSGEIVQQITPFTEEQCRSIIRIGRIIHINGQTVDFAQASPSILNAPINQLDDLARAIGLFNKSGNNYTPNTNLSINKSIGELYGIGENLKNNANNPSVVSIAAETPVFYKYRFSNETELPFSSAINPTIYEDPLGSSATVNNNNWTNQRIFLFPSGRTIIQPGQAQYNTYDEARASIATEVFTKAQSIADDALLRAILIVKKEATNLSDTGTAVLIPASRFGDTGSAGGSSGGSTTLQDAYDNSSEPEIETNSTLGAVTFKRGALAPSEVIEIKNQAGATTGKWHGSGDLSAVNITALTVSAHALSATTVNGKTPAGREVSPATSAIAFWDSVEGIFKTDTGLYWNGTRVVASDNQLPFINDSVSATQDTYSSSKIESLLLGKLDTSASFALSELNNVFILNPEDGQVLTYISATDDWRNADPTGSGNSGGVGANIQTCYLTNCNGTVNFGGGSTQFPRYAYIPVSTNVYSMDKFRFYLNSIDSAIDFEVAVYEVSGSNLNIVTSGSVSADTAGFVDATMDSAVTFESGKKYYASILRKSTTGNCEFAIESCLSTTDIGFQGAGITVPGGTFPTTESSRTPLNYVIWTQMYSSTGGYGVSATGSGFEWSTTTKIADYNAVPYNVVLANTTAGPFTVTLPDASAAINTEIKVKKISSDPNVVTVSAGDLIDSESSKILSKFGTAISIVSDGIQWWIV